MLQPEIPRELGDRFAVSAAVHAGVPRSRLRKRDVESAFHGTRRLAAADPVDTVVFGRFGQRRGVLEQDLLERALEYATRMSEHEFYSHVTAAVVWDIPLPLGCVAERALDVAVLGPHRLPRSSGVRGHEIVPGRVSVRREPRTGLMVTSPASTWATLASVLTDPYDLVAAGDGVVRDWRTQPLATIGELESAIASGRRVGINKLRAALPLVRTRSASRPETHARLILTDAGLPEPELNYDIFVDGVRIACSDLAYPELLIAMEYEGEHHLLDPQQWARDIARYEALAASGWLVIRITKGELAGAREDLVRRVRAAIAQRS